MSGYTTIRVSLDLHARIKALAQAEQRTVSAVVGRAIDRYVGVSDSTELAPLGSSDCPIVRPTAISSVDARKVVLDNVPRHLLSNSKTRTGLEEQVQQMTVDGCDPRGIVLSLQEWVNRPDAYPGHLPHIYTELLRARTARPKSKTDDKVQGWIDLGRQMKEQREMRQ